MHIYMEARGQQYMFPNYVPSFFLIFVYVFALVQVWMKALRETRRRFWLPCKESLRVGARNWKLDSLQEQ